VLRRAPVPVLAIPPHVGDVWPAERTPTILLPLDGSKLAEAALQPVAALAASLGAALVLVQVIAFPPFSLYADDGAYLAAFDCHAAVAGAQEYEVQWSKSLNPWRSEGIPVRTGATSALLPLTAGRWYYRVRGLNPLLPGRPEMTWSKAVAIKIAKPHFKIVTH